MLFEKIMRAVADATALAVIFLLAWLVLTLAKVSVFPPVQCAAMFTVVVGAYCLRLWSPGQWLHGAQPRNVALILLAWPVLTLLSLLIDAHLAHVNLLHIHEWPGLWQSGNVFGFILTVALAVGMPAIAVATLIRIVLWSLLGRRAPAMLAEP